MPNRPVKFIAPTPGASVAFDQLLPCSWRGIEVPASAVRFSFSHDLAEHKYVGVDGANLEATGRNSMQIEVVIPFFNGIYPGKNEQWKAGKLFPEVYRKFLDAFFDRKDGNLQHPELGTISCKPESIDYALSPDHRDGVEVTARFRETVSLAREGDFKPGASSVTKLTEAAANLDAAHADIKGKIAKYQRPEHKETFAEFANKLTAQIDKVSTTAALAANRPNQIAYRFRQVGAAVDRARTPLTWPMTEAITQAHIALHDLAMDVTKGTRKVLRHTVQAATTLSTLTSLLPGSNVDDLIQLNPQLVARPSVPAGAVVRYYAP